VKILMSKKYMNNSEKSLFWDTIFLYKDPEKLLDRLYEETIDLFDPAITGMILGDGRVDVFKNKSPHSTLKLLQRKKNKDLCEDLVFNFVRTGLYGSLNVYSQYGQSYGWHVMSKTCWYFGKLRKMWYDKNGKIVPKNIVITLETVAYWFMCDGSEYWNNKKTKDYLTITFGTYGYTEDEVDFLVSKLQKLKINAKKKRWVKVKEQFIIIITHQKDIDEFNKMMEPYILSDFKYKIKER